MQFSSFSDWLCLALSIDLESYPSSFREVYMCSAAGLLAAPYGKLPYIEYNGKTYGQSAAIATFLARELGYYGQTNLHGLRIDEVLGLCYDQIENLSRYRWELDAEKKTEYLRKVVEEDLPHYFGIFEKLLKENNSSGYFVGGSLTLADFAVYDMVDNLLQVKIDAVDGFPLLRRLRQNVEADPNIKKYLCGRKETIF